MMLTSMPHPYYHGANMNNMWIAIRINTYPWFAFTKN
nr:MAG TPA: 60S ribosomal subunit [Caudoviricetes sp.]